MVLSEEVLQVEMRPNWKRCVQECVPRGVLAAPSSSIFCFLCTLRWAALLCHTLPTMRAWNREWNKPSLPKLKLNRINPASLSCSASCFLVHWTPKWKDTQISASHIAHTMLILCFISCVVLCVLCAVYCGLTHTKQAPCTRAKFSSCEWPMAYKAKNSYYLPFYRKHLL